MEYKLVLDQAVLDEYAEVYFKLHPRARKRPIEKPWPETLNQIIIMSRMQMNALKQKWSDFGKWWVQSLGLVDLRLERFELEVKVFKDSNRRFDLDNLIQKNVLDAFTRSGLIVDDDHLHLQKLSITADVDREHPRTEYIFRTIE